MIVLAAFVVLGGVCNAAEFIEIKVPLEDGRFYQLRDLYRECNTKLGSRVPLETIADRKVELTRAERAALLLVAETGIIRVAIDSDSLTLSVPDHEDDQVRRENRRRLERLLGVQLSTWPQDKGLHLPVPFDPKKPAIVLIHGLESDATDLERFRIACEKSLIQYATFDYPNDGPLAWSGDRLSQELKTLTSKHRDLRLVIVAHSMGGLVARHALEAPGNDPGCVSTLFTLGTPHRGSQLATIGSEWLELIFQPLTSVKQGVKALQDGLGEAAEDLRPGSRFLSRLNGYGAAKGVRYYSAVGEKSFVSRAELKAIKQHLLQLFRRRRVAPATQRMLLAYLSSSELQDGDGDGAVAITSARCKYAKEQKAFACNHLELLSLPGERPEDHEVFRWIMAIPNWQKNKEPLK